MSQVISSKEEKNTSRRKERFSAIYRKDGCSRYIIMMLRIKILSPLRSFYEVRRKDSEENVTAALPYSGSQSRLNNSATVRTKNSIAVFAVHTFWKYCVESAWCHLDVFGGCWTVFLRSSVLAWTLNRKNGKTIVSLFAMESEEFSYIAC